jgi:hypothetical protein
MYRSLLVAALLGAAASVVAAPLTPEAIEAVQDRRLPSKEIEASLPDSHPMMYFLYAAKLFRAGKQDPATRWFYVGQIRFTHHLLANPGLPADGDPTVLAGVNKNYGPAFSDWAGGNIRIWLQSIKDALAWDAVNPNNFTSKETYANELAQARAQVTATYDTINRTQAQIKAERASRGMSDR